MNVATLGFRGEALAALCSLSQKVSILTRDSNSENGYQFEYVDSKGWTDPLPLATKVTTFSFLYLIASSRLVQKLELLDYFGLMPSELVNGKEI